MQQETDAETPKIISFQRGLIYYSPNNYRLQIGQHVKYLTIFEKRYTRPIPSFPDPSLPTLPDTNTGWTSANISRNLFSGELDLSVSYGKLAAVQNVWYETQIDVLDLLSTEVILPCTYEAKLPVSAFPDSSWIWSLLPSPLNKVTVVAKIARFEFEIEGIERETRAYQILQQRQASDLAPRFLGHIHENGRIMGLLHEKPKRRSYASAVDLVKCEEALAKFHKLGLLLGDVHLNHFLIGRHDAVIIDFQKFEEDASAEKRRKEMRDFRAPWTNETVRGGEYMFFDGND